MRLNRMFWADGREGVERYAAIVDRYAAAGFPSELQVRYHPPEGAEGAAGAMQAREDYVRMAARILGAGQAATGLSIRNEANFSMSPNTSAGSPRPEPNDEGRPDAREERPSLPATGGGAVVGAGIALVVALRLSRRGRGR